MNNFTDQSVEDELRSTLCKDDVVIDTLGSVLRHLLANDDHSLFSDEIVARVRGMLSHVARQLLHSQVSENDQDSPVHSFEPGTQGLVDCFLSNAAFLSHVHALAIEGQLAERIQTRNSVDPVLSPLLQALIASDDEETASAAMMTLAAQSRFVQSQRRMELPLLELPGDLFHFALITMRTQAGEEGDEAASLAEVILRAKFNESESRLGLLSRLVTGMGNGAIAALSVSHAGLAIFLTGLGLGSGQDRDLAVLATSERLLVRLALSLSAAGLKPEAVAEQFLYLHPEISLPEGFEYLSSDRAAALLSASSLHLTG